VSFISGFNLGWQGFRRSLVQPPPQAGPALGSDWAAQNFAQVGLENREWTLHNLTGQWFNPAKDGQGHEGRNGGGCMECPEVCGQHLEAICSREQRLGKRGLKEKIVLQCMLPWEGYS